ncbi:hypothetical protein [Paenibacillus sp. IHBB 10380]|uniref:hypothetical protein n=1 Tax=Paenibacillus sp. IHBB 10380 TaxID=1566358 RepID=UPI0005CFDE10|nr:hypothetical protein [Paenibacillus sp. IHBB 10380]AJS59320.1 hypothetical protein UB51_13525 [Paenibacillus sp. IHBB 10380]
MKIEIKSLGVKSMFKTTLYIASIPAGLMFVIGVLSLIIGIASGNQSIVVAVIPFIVMPFIIIGLYGLLGMLLGVSYNFFAPKFGGLEITIKTQEQEVIMQNNQD